VAVAVAVAVAQRLPESDPCCKIITFAKKNDQKWYQNGIKMMQNGIKMTYK
jgi:hypothetical protein